MKQILKLRKSIRTLSDKWQRAITIGNLLSTTLKSKTKSPSTKLHWLDQFRKTLDEVEKELALLRDMLNQIEGGLNGDLKSIKYPSKASD